MSDVQFGHEDEWEYFSKRCGPAMDALVKAHEVCLELLNTAKPEKQEEHVLYLLAASCLKEIRRTSSPGRKRIWERGHEVAT
jgi:hypothetical protein